MNLSKQKPFDNLNDALFFFGMKILPKDDQGFKHLIQFDVRISFNWVVQPPSWMTYIFCQALGNKGEISMPLKQGNSLFGNLGDECLEENKASNHKAKAETNLLGRNLWQQVFNTKDLIFLYQGYLCQGLAVDHHYRHHLDGPVIPYKNGGTHEFVLKFGCFWGI